MQRKKNRVHDAEESAYKKTNKTSNLTINKKRRLIVEVLIPQAKHRWSGGTWWTHSWQNAGGRSRHRLPQDGRISFLQYDSCHIDVAIWWWKQCLLCTELFRIIDTEHVCFWANKIHIPYSNCSSVQANSSKSWTLFCLYQFSPGGVFIYTRNNHIWTVNDGICSEWCGIGLSSTWHISRNYVHWWMSRGVLYIRFASCSHTDEWFYSFLQFWLL